MIVSEESREVPRGEEENEDELQLGTGDADGERAQGQALVDESKILGGGETSGRSALWEGATPDFKNERDGAISVATGEVDKAL